MKTPLDTIVNPLLAWYDTAKRDLPWRGNPTPYEVWVSEIMLQQTRVEAVREYYLRWMATLPTVEDLDKADLDTVRKLWEGLGYYSRMRHLKEAAAIIVRDYQGQLPQDPAKLAALPGIGEYTAGAICSIAFGLPTPAVDGNVLRVLARIWADETDILTPSARSQATSALARIMPRDRAGDFTQAMFELGALVCLPKEPKCDLCPVRDLCQAYREGRQRDLPVRIVKTKRKMVDLTVLVLTDGERYALTPAKEEGLLAGMYGLPTVEGKLPLCEVEGAVRALGVIPRMIEELPEGKHVFTHVTWRMIGYRCAVDRLPEGCVPATAEEVASTYALPTAFGGYKKWIN